MNTHVVSPRSKSFQDAAAAVACVLAAVTLAAAKPHEAGTCYLRTGDRVVFYGDSITEQSHYTRPVETFLRTRCPELNVPFINSGWAGDRAWGGDRGMLEERLRRDVIAHQPTVVTVMLGMNDGYYTNFDATAVTAFKASLEQLIDTLQRALPGVRITLIGTSPYDNVTPGEQPEWEEGIQGGYNSVVSRYSAATREVADKHGLLFVDMHEPLVGLLERLQAKNPQLARQLIPDRIHPGPAAGMVMAARLLAAWNVPTAGREIIIEGEPSEDGAIHDRRTLPPVFTFDGDEAHIKLVRQMSPDLKPFTDDTLRVSSLPFPHASLKIDGEELGKFSAEQLAAGVNLAEHDSPLRRQAAAVARLVDLRNQAHLTRWRNFEFSFAKDAPPNIQQTAARLAALEEELAELEVTAAQPQTHTIEIIATEQ